MSEYKRQKAAKSHPESVFGGGRAKTLALAAIIGCIPLGIQPALAEETLTKTASITVTEDENSENLLPLNTEMLTDTTESNKIQVNEGQTIEKISDDFINNPKSDHGGAIENNKGTINLITNSNFSGNSAEQGGTIYNSGTIESIKDSTFTGNTADQGGAIYNAGTISNINNVTYKNNNITDQVGGFIYNAENGQINSLDAKIRENTATIDAVNRAVSLVYNKGNIGSITGLFENNQMITNNDLGSSNDAFYVCNFGTIDNINVTVRNNSVTGDNRDPWALIFTSEGGTINSVAGTFDNNTFNVTGSSEGTVIGIYENSRINEIDGIFKNNNNIGDNRSCGGVINLFARNATAGSINGIYINNSAQSTHNAKGGVINLHIENSSVGATVDTIGTADRWATFNGNHAISDSGTAQGGAICNAGTIGSIYANFTNNYVKSNTGSALGGAIYNSGTINTLVGDFTGNYSEGSGQVSRGSTIFNTNTGNIKQIGTTENWAYFIGNHTKHANTVAGDGDGGAIYNSGTIEAIRANFVNNYIESSSPNGTAGAAILNNNTIGILADTQDIYFLNNKVIQGTSTSYNDIYGYGTLNLNAGTGHSISFGGTVVGGTINVNNDTTTHGGKYIFYNTVSGGTLNLYNGADVQMGSMTQDDGTKTSGILNLESFTSNGSGNILSTINCWQNHNSGEPLQPRQEINLGNVVLNADTILRTDMNTSTGDIFKAASFSGSGAFVLDRILFNNEVNVGNSASYTMANSVLKDHIRLASNMLVYSTYKKGDYAASYDAATGNLTITRTGNGVYNLAGFLALDTTDSIYTMSEDEDFNDSVILTMVGTNKTVNASNYTISSDQKPGISLTSDQTLTINGGRWDGFKTTNRGGGAIYNSGGTLNIDGSIFENNKGSGLGGTVNAQQGSNTVIKNSLFRNNTTTTNGGALYNRETIGETARAVMRVENSTFIGNSAKGVGGAITNCGLMNIIDSVFKHNVAQGHGGALTTGEYIGTETIISAINKDVIFDNNTSKTSYAGAINNTSILSIIANGADIIFSNNSAVTGGGAIYHHKSPNGTATEVTLDISAPNGKITFQNNYVSGSSELTHGGAIYNINTITNIDADFINNYVIGEKNAVGGAIYSQTANSIIGNINGDFKGNYAISETTLARGGAIDSDGKIAIINGNFQNNYVKGATEASGGAIWNNPNASIERIHGDFIGNSATATGTEDTAAPSGTRIYGAALGGAIYNAGTIGSDTVIAGTYDIEGDFSGNSVTSPAYIVGGGAIFNATTGNLAIKNGIKGNFSNNSATLTTVQDNTGHAPRGAAIYNMGNIGNITGSFSNNAITSTTFVQGGAIMNNGFDKSSASIGDIVGDFINNSAVGRTYAQGGAIMTVSKTESNYTATIGNITGNFTGNYAKAETNYAQGGAFYSAGLSTTGDISGNFSNNYASGYNAQGGAIFNQSGTINSIRGTVFSGNHTISSNTVELDQDTSAGGVIWNSGTIPIIKADFTGNYNEGNNTSAGAIYNSGQITTIEGNFADNYGLYQNGGRGGAIANRSNGQINTIRGSFIGNYLEGNNGGWGGAIFNEGYKTADTSIDNIYADFTNNYVTSKFGLAYGGAIFTNGVLTSITNLSGKFEHNYANAKSEAHGGAIKNGGQITNITDSNFVNNYAISVDSNAFGGAIYNSGTITKLEADFTGNYAQSETGTEAYGGAIYNAVNDSDATTTIGNITGDFINNSVITLEIGGMSFGGAIYNAGTIGDIGSSTNYSNFSGNYAKANMLRVNQVAGKNTNAHGGAIYNTSGTIGDIYANFTNNYTLGAQTDGSAIYNTVGGSIGNINGDFTGNYAQGYLNVENDTTIRGHGQGAAIYNLGVIKEINSNFYNNYTIGRSSNGGAIFNHQGGGTYAGSVGKIGVITGEFKGNYVQGTHAASWGGAIFNNGTIDGINGKFSNNYVTVSNFDGYGGAIFNSHQLGSDSSTGEYSYIGDIAADFIENHVESGLNAFGGAINNGETATIKSISGEFRGNYTNTSGTEPDSSNAFGGAIYNAGTIKSIFDSTFSGNYVTSNSNNGSALGGAIYNLGSIAGIEGEFTDNYVQSASGESVGGAIYNSGTISSLNSDFTYNYVKNETSVNAVTFAGGAIANTTTGNISSIITGNFSNNYIKNTAETENLQYARGGAISNRGYIEGIQGTFEGNYISNASGQAIGGAIFNGDSASNSIIKTLNSNFNNNYVQTNKYQSHGGAIFNYGRDGYTTEINSITGNFTGNHAIATETANAVGGAIANQHGAVIGSINGNFKDNYILSETYAKGGAIQNGSTISSIEGDFTGNYATADQYAEGGAIHNSGTISLLKGNLNSNYVTTTSDYAWGGAIYNIGTITTLEGSFDGNYIISEQNKTEGGAIYNSNKINTISANFSNNSASGTLSQTWGGALLNTNDAQIGSITGNFADNSVIGTGNRAAGGAIYNASYEDRLGKINTINGNFERNFVQSTSIGYGGALANTGILGSTAEDGSITGKIIGDFIDNYVSAATSSHGGAVYNSSSITSIEGDFTGNYAEGSNTRGGAIWNSGTIANLIGNFTDNFVRIKTTSEDAFAQGGAISNQGTINLIDGDFENNTADSSGGAIINFEGGNINEIQSNFTNNSADIAGGAIYNISNENSTGKINSINGKFEGNFVQAATLNYGGAIANSGGEITSLNGSYVGNYAQSSGNGALGGAIYNNPTGSIKNIEADFTSNNVLGITDAQGGAIYNRGSIGSETDENITYSIKGNFTGNYAIKDDNTQTGNALGGAIYNDGYISGIQGNFDSNYIQGANSYGGAIYNSSTINTIDGDFTNNYSQSEGGTVLGGAIYNEGNIQSINSKFENNYLTAGTNSHAEGGAITNKNKITNIIGEFINNKVNTSDNSTLSYAQGGAILNLGRLDSINATFTGNQAKADQFYARGGALYNTSGTGIGTITGNFTNNSTLSYSTNSGGGGAIWNEKTIGNLEADFTENNSIATSGGSSGGAIRNSSTIGTIDENGNITGKIKGNFNNNYVKSESTSTDSENATGGAIFNIGTITTIEGNFEGNYVQTRGGNAVGGAIDNLGNLGSISGNFTNNHTISEHLGYGGAIYNRIGTIENINGDFSKNYVSGTNKAVGGAIENQGTINNIESNFEGNYVVSSSGESKGGAVYNNTDGTIGIIEENGTITGKLKGDFIGNYAQSDTASAQGGAVYNAGIINLIDSTFINNSALGYDTLGGAIYNNEGTITTISGDFTGNKASGSSSGRGGAIYNYNTITNIEGNFDRNYVSGNYAYGGAVFNENYRDNEKAIIGNITGDFTNNYATANYYAHGGAIYNSSTGGEFSQNISSNFTGNYAEGKELASGGAIFNGGTIGDLIGNTFSDNYVDSVQGIAQGGAIYNTTTSANGLYNLTNVTFTNNYSHTTSGTAQGGAIWTDFDLNIKADKGTAKFEGNYIQNAEQDKVYDAIYMGNSSKNLTLGAYNEGKVLFYDNIDGANGYLLTLNGDTTSKIDLTGLVKNASTATLNTTHLTFAENTFNSDGLIFKAESGFIELQDNEFKTYTIDKISSNETVNWNLDIDMLNEKSDVIKTNQASSGKIYIDSVSIDGIPVIDGEHKVQVLHTQSSDLQLALNSALTNKNVLKEEHVDGDAIITNDVAWNHTFYDGHFDYTTYGQLGLTNSSTLNDTIVYKISTELTGEDYTKAGDTLTLWNTHIPEDNAAKNFNFASAKDVYATTDNVGTSAGSTLNINGVANGNEKSTIDFVSKNSGFVLTADKTLNINNVAFINAVDSTGSIVDVAEGATVNLNGVTQAAISTNALLKNDGTMNFKGNTSSINSNISGSGALNVDSQVKLFENATESGISKVEQNSITVHEGGRLEVFGHGKLYSDLTIDNGGYTSLSSSGITREVLNNGSLSIYSGTLANTINGTGTTTIVESSTVTNNSGINQAVSVLSGATLNNNANIGSSTGLISNAGTINTNADYLNGKVDNSNILNILGGTVNNEIYGIGSTTIQNNLVNSAGIKQEVTVNNGVTLTNNAALGSDTGIITNAGTINSSATNIKGNVTNSNTLNLNGGELNKTVSGEGTTNITGNVTSNASIGQNINITDTAALTSSASNIGGAVDNAGDLTLTGGTLAQNVSGEGATNITGNVTSNASIGQNINIANASTLTSSASNIGGVVDNDGNLTLNGGILAQNVSGDGETNITGNVTSNASIGQNINITDTAALTSNASNIGGVVANAGNLTLTGGTLAQNVSGEGETNITGNVTSNASISQNINITDTAELISNASNIGGIVANAGALTLTGGTLAQNISGEGTTNITGNVTSNALIDQNIDITSTGNLTSNASNIGGEVANTGDLTLTGGTLAQNVSGNGKTNITGNVTSNALIDQNIDIANNGALTSNASRIGGTVDNDGVLTLTDGTLAQNVSGNGKTNITGTVINNSVIQQNVEILASGNLTNNNNIGNVVNNGNLTSDANNLTGTIENNNTLNLSGTINKAITGDGTTYVENSLTLTSGADIQGTVNAATGSLISVSGNKDAQYSIGKLTGEGDVNVSGGNFSIKHNANLHDLNNSGNTTIEGNLIATGDITNENTLTIKGNTAAQNVTNNGDMDVLGSLVVNEIIRNTGDLDIFGTAQAKEIINTGNMTVQNNATVDVTGNVTTTENITTSGNLWVIGSINAKDLSNDGDLTVGNNVTVNTFTNNKTAEISGDVTITGVVEDGKTSFQNKGSATIDGTLNVTGDITNSNNLTVDGHVNAKDILNDTNSTLAFKHGAEIQDFTNKGNAEITGNLSANEVINDNELTISGNLTTTSNVTSSGTLTLGQDLTTQGDILNRGNMIVTGNVSANNISNTQTADIGGSLTATGNITNSKKLTVKGQVKAQDVTNNSEAILTFKNNAEIQNLTNDGSATIEGSLNATGNIVNNNELTVNNKVTAKNINNTKTLNFKNGTEVKEFTNSGTADIVNGLNSNNIINSATLNLSAGAINVDTISNTSVINITNGANAVLNSSINGEGGNITITDSTFTTNGNIRNQNITANNSTINLGNNSEVLKSSVLNVNNSNIYTTDNKYTNYIMDELNSSANSRYHIDIHLSREEQQSDTFTLVNGGSGTIFLSSINVQNNCNDNDKFRLQIIKSGTNNAPQLDYDKSKVLDQASANMSNDMIIAKEFGLYSTDTLNDTLEIRGWRDVFGEWSEFEADEDKAFTFVNDDKFTLTRDVLGFSGDNIAIIGQGNIFDSNDYNWYQQINENQTLSISDLKIINNKGEMDNKGHLILNNVYHDKDIINNNILELNNNIALEKLTNNAQLTHKGENIAINDFTNSGTAEITTTNAAIKNLTNNKNLNITGNLTSSAITNNSDGDISLTGNLTSQKVTNTGNINIEGTAQISNLTNDNKFTITGDFNAENITNNSELNVNKSTLNTGKITAKDSGSINITDSTFNTFGQIEKQNISAAKSTINVADPYFLVNDSLTLNNSTMNLGALSLKPLHINNLEMTNGTINIPSVQVDFSNNTMSRLITDSAKADNNSVINLNNLNNINVPAKETELVKMQFADTSISHNVSYNGQDTIYAPIYRYGVSYNPEDGNMFFVRGGKFNPATGKIDTPVNPAQQFNPAIFSSSVAAQTAANSTMNQTYNYVFQNAENFMAYPLKDRMAIINRNKYALNEIAPGLDIATNSPLFSINTESSSWYKPYANFETIDYKNGPKVHATTYGSLAGFDTSIKSLKNGWARTYTGYVGYNGATQSFEGVHTTQNGGLLGGTITLYKGNFFNATTISAGATVAETSSMYGHDDTTMLIAGAANKTGYNFEFKEGRYIIQPNILVSYTFVNTFNYTNAAGVRLDSDPLHSIQVAPGFKLMANTKTGWQPYIAANMVMNFLDKSKTTADTVRLPGMSTRPYVQYGIGLQKTFKENFIAFGQTMFQSGGRHGVSISAGLRWTFGHESSTKEKVQNNNSNEQVVNTIKRAPIPTANKPAQVNNQPVKSKYQQTNTGKTVIKKLNYTTQTVNKGIIKQI